VIPIVVVGAAGRMGRAVVETAKADPVFQVKAGVDRAPRPGDWDPALPWLDDAGSVLARGDVAVEFAGPEGAVFAARACAACGAGLVSGSTGLSSAQDEALREASASVAILRSANFSLGILALRRALSAVLSAIPSWDIEVVERHHRSKKDSPSGTALALAHQAADARGWPASSLRHGRQGPIGVRPDAEIGVHSLRGGSWVGDHAVLLGGPGEWLELRHVAQDRVAFAHGALLAVEFLSKAMPGLYTFENVVESSDRSTGRRRSS
jgi:4-hydroxy-tetrahydrodipicolinate reductase